MKVLITGATGLIGSELVHQCLERGIAVHYLTTRKSKIKKEPNFSGFLWNPEKNEIDDTCFEGVSAIINLAGASISKRWSSSYKKVIVSSRINTLQTLHKALKKRDTSTIKHFVSASAIGIYPDSLTHNYDENHTVVDASFLGDVVQAWENEIETFKEFDFTVAMIRIGLVLSKNGGALIEMAKPVKAYAGAAFGSGQQWQSWIHVTDLAKMFLYTSDQNLLGTYNGVAPNPVRQSTLMKTLAKVLKRPLWLPNIPKFVMKTVLGEMTYLLFASQQVSSKKIEEAGFTYDHANIVGALEDIFSNQ